MDPAEAIEHLDKLTNCAPCEIDGKDRKAIEALLSACGRTELSEEQIERAVSNVSDKLEYRLAEKGRQSFASCHESYGIISEEMNELLRAIESGDFGDINEEFIDVAVAAIMGYACHTFMTSDW